MMAGTVMGMRYVDSRCYISRFWSLGSKIAVVIGFGLVKTMTMDRITILRLFGLVSSPVLLFRMMILLRWWRPT
jgi:hypothetical protein